MTPAPEQPPNNGAIESESCIPPVYGNGFSYPINSDTENLSYPGLNTFISPAKPWEVEIALPELNQIVNWERREIGVILSRQVLGHSEVWIHISSGLEKDSYLAFYRSDTNEWKVIPELIDTLIVDKKGTLWGSHSGVFGYAPQPYDVNVLSVYDDLTNSFLPVEDVQHLPAVIERDASSYYSRVVLGNDGMLWILVPADGIYKYDPSAGETQKLFDLPEAFRDAKINSDGIIYVLFNNVYYRNGEQGHNYILKYYDTKTGKQGEHALVYSLEPYPTPLTLLIDHQGRVWMDNIAYLEENTLHQIVRSPLFVSPIREQYNDYRYKRADVILESSDGRIWFLHRNNGMIWLDPEKGEWCWFTTYQSNIVEDSEHNLWMVADGKLYKNSLGQ
jgi:hypothetical protein